MKKVILLAFLIFLLILPLLPQNKVEKEFKAQPGELLDLNLKSGGTLSITRGDGNLVFVSVFFKDSDPGDWGLEFVPFPRGLKIESRYTGKKNAPVPPAFDIRVPARFDLKLKTLGGDIAIAGVEGDISARTMGGKMDIKNIKGEIYAKTLSGDILLRDSEVEGRVKTANGRVAIENVKGDIKGTSLVGNVVYKNVKTHKDTNAPGKMVYISTMGGSINVSEAPEGADVSTLGGGIHILSAKKFVKAKTLKGNIKIDSLDGWVSAETVNGDIEIKMVGDPGKGKRDVTLSNTIGNISLTLPPGLSMDIEIELGLAGGGTAPGKIVSDFELEETVSGLWNCESGTPIKFIKARGKVKDGKNKIRIKTLRGKVYLREDK